MSWKIDSAHSEINFTVRHMMISNVRGRFETFNATVDFNQNEPALSSVYAEIDAASINTREPNRDGHLRSPDFLNAEQYPKLTFESTRVEPLGKNHGKIYGDLTIREITHEVVLDVEYSGQAKSPWGLTSAGFSAETKINRKDWNLVWNQALETGGVLVGDEITIHLDLELIKEQEAELETALAG